jgi:cysteine-rich repeat protein
MLGGLCVARRLVALLVLVCAGLYVPEARADVAGTWRRLDAPALERHVLADAGGGHVTLTIDVEGLPATFTGSVSGAFGIAGTGHPCTVQWSGVVFAGATQGEALIDGLLGWFCPVSGSAGYTRLTLARCECDDGNADDGDGCDATCRVEPCWMCAGEPSVCTPLGDGAACDDRADCTTGTTCSAGACGGGVTQPACVDMSGTWTSHENTFVGPVEVTYDVEQRDGVLVLHDAPSGTLSYVGTIDTATGAFDASEPWGALVCLPLRVPFTGVADAATFSGQSAVRHAAMGTCTLLTSSIQGTRQEPCVALPNGSACDDGNPCTTGDVCTNSACGGFVVDDGTSCDDGNACTTGDVCTAGVCTSGPPLECGQCETCDAEGGCQPRPDGTSCEDGSACTTGDTCSAGTCTSGEPLECGACRACDDQDGCIAAPRPVCEEPTGNKVTLTARRLPLLASRPPSLVFKWKGGDGVTLGELGDPTVDERYTLCVYDESGPTPSLLFKASAPPGSCGTEPCWIPAGSKGYKYKSRSALGDGIMSIMLKPGAAGKASVVLKGKGSALANRPDGMPAPGFALPLRVQFQGESGACFGARFTSAGVQKNAAGLFKGKGQP